MKAWAPLHLRMSCVYVPVCAQLMLLILFCGAVPSPAHKIGVMLAALSIILVSASRGTLWEMRTAHGTPPNTTDDATLQRQLPLSAPRYQN